MSNTTAAGKPKPTPYRDPAIAAPDPTADPRAAALLKAQPHAIDSWGSRLHGLAELASQTSSSLHEIASGVHWTGDAASSFLATVAKIRPQLDNLSDSYLAASQSIWTYSSRVETDQHHFKACVEVINGMTEVLKVLDPAHAGSTPSATVIGDQQQLLTAKSNGFKVLDDFETSRKAVETSLSEAASRAPHAPPWWQKNIATLINEMAGLKGVTRTDRQRAADLANAEKAYAEDPSAANKKRVEQDLAAVNAIANAANRDGKHTQAKELLADEAGSLQRLSDRQQGLLGTNKHDLITSTEQDQVVSDLKAGDLGGAESALLAMAASTFGQYQNKTKGDPTTTGTEEAKTEQELLAKQAGTTATKPPAKKPPAKKPPAKTPPAKKPPATNSGTPKTHPLTTNSPIEIKGLRPNASQVANLNTVLAEAAKLHAPTLACVALVEACIQESTCENLNYGSGTSTGILQFESSTAADLGISPMNITQCADAFLTRNYYYGPPFYGDARGAIGYANAHPGATADQIAQSCQGSAYPSAYGQWQSEAQQIVAQYGLG